MLGNLIGGFITILVGISLMPTVANQVYAAGYNSTGGGTNVTGAALAVLNLTTTFFALAIMAAAVAVGMSGLKQAGMI